MSTKRLRKGIKKMSEVIALLGLWVIITVILMVEIICEVLK